ncbi:adenine glycosylase, partial [Actinotalea fermentans ATCC 43279 = JCM 9966 = DSM 3133]
WEGTDRQARGRVMAALRGSDGPVHRDVVAGLWPDAAQLGRCVASLVEDGLLEQDGDVYRLPA